MVPRIRQIQIQNFKSIERAVVDLEPFTALVGTNGAGKTNFVEALTFVQECLSLSIGEAFGRLGEISVFPRWSSSLPEIKVGFRLRIDLSEESSADYSFEITGNWDGAYRVSREKCILRFSDREDGFEVHNGSFVREIAGIRPKMEPDRLALFAASGTEEYRPLYDFLSAMRAYSIEHQWMRFAQTTDSGMSLDSTGRNAASVLRALKQRQPDAYELINGLLAHVVGEPLTVSARTLEQNVDLRFRKDTGDQSPTSFSGFDMSEGTLRILGLLLAVLQPRRPSLLVIEEPEATVHPASAELVVEVLLNAARDRQVVVTTHSPDLLDAKELTEEQIRVVTMERGRTIIAPLSQASRWALRERLYTPGELLRIDELSQDVEAAKEAARHLDLFGEATILSPS